MFGKRGNPRSGVGQGGRQVQRSFARRLPLDGVASRGRGRRAGRTAAGDPGRPRCTPPPMQTPTAPARRPRETDEAYYDTKAQVFSPR